MAARTRKDVLGAGLRLLHLFRLSIMDKETQYERY